MEATISQVKFKTGLPLGIEVLPIASTVSRHREAMRLPHRADFYHVLWVQQGTAEYFIDFEPVKVPANSFLFISKDRVKSLYSNSYHDGKILIFTDSFYSQSEEDVKYLHSTILFNELLELSVLDVTALPSLQTVFNELERELATEFDTYQAGIAHSLLRGLLLQAERERRKQGVAELPRGADFDYTARFRDLLKEQYRELKSVGAYASQVGVTEKRLTTATNKTIGKSPKTIIDERVVLEAKRLLIHTNLPVKQVGYELGFEEPTYFIKYFRKHTACTPAGFRESFPAR